MLRESVPHQNFRIIYFHLNLQFFLLQFFTVFIYCLCQFVKHYNMFCINSLQIHVALASQRGLKKVFAVLAFGFTKATHT